MKVLWVDPSEAMLKQWGPAMRAEGWGIIQAKSVLDADRAVQFHRASLNLVIVNRTHSFDRDEDVVGWIERMRKGLLVKIPFGLITDQQNQELSGLSTVGPGASAQDVKLWVSSLTGVRTTFAEAVGATVLQLESVAQELRAPDPGSGTRKITFQNPTVAFDATAFREKLELERTRQTDVEEYTRKIEKSSVSAQRSEKTALNSVGLSPDIIPFPKKLASLPTPQEGQALPVETDKRIIELESKIAHYDAQKNIEFEALQSRIDDLKMILTEKNAEIRVKSAENQNLKQELEKVKGRVQSDLRRIRVREHELENQLEVLKADSSALIKKRDEHVRQLRGKLELVEFNFELVKDQLVQERDRNQKLKERLLEAVKAMRSAGSVLDPEAIS